MNFLGSKAGKSIIGRGKECVYIENMEKRNAWGLEELQFVIVG